jgi:hypothetical protein
VTSGELDVVRSLIDRAVRARLEPLQAAFAGVFYCSGCGIELDDWTPGCGQCWGRQRGRMRYGHLSVEAFEREAARQREFRYAEQSSRQNGRPNPHRHGDGPTWAHNIEALGLGA